MAKAHFIPGSVAGLGITLGATGSFAQDACQPFTLAQDMNQRSVEFVDRGEAGVSPGDLRIGRVVLLDESGNEAGVMRWVTRALDSPPMEGETSHSIGEYTMLLDNGQIHWRLLGETVSPPDDVDTPSVSNPQGLVLGGTGTFSNARGNVDVSLEEGVAFAFTIRCD